MWFSIGVVLEVAVDEEAVIVCWRYLMALNNFHDENKIN